MRKIGLIGGMSWVSTASYYTRINRIVQNRLGGFSSPHMLIESVNFSDYARLQSDDDWDAAAGLMTRSAKRLENSGATAVLICSNAMHKIYDRVQPEIGVPILHIADCVGDKMVADGIKSATLVGTRNVMTEGFYRKRLVGKGITLSPPDEERVEEIDRIIYEELMFGQAKRESERTMKTYITNIAKQEIEAIVLGCTELDLIVDTKANILPIYDSTEIHADAAIEWILGEA
ncbi:amino acid racemase [Parasphingorhabdus flavimaris]|mgnify:FL=1|jgi:aspartate racemase|uniref:Amino acid racemase n=1 Tax=Parasphingorhabdus flavimaris TaxID=266812 RepID=A0ABX2N3P0_9SPHN|nr:amino acid racemase [Parasphingorhabdus flavimaris]NVD28228.1 amino acid racemase [Parasphingorhabdus flavimaris]|tara:strand:+ start:44373 stop:45068 length:696 start_codon:yes stop_codon:yes gene_type:complete